MAYADLLPSFGANFVIGTTSVTVHEVRILSDSGKSDFVIAGEGVTLSCLFMLDPGEVLESVVWEKDKEQVSTFFPSFSLVLSLAIRMFQFCY